MHTALGWSLMWDRTVISLLWTKSFHCLRYQMSCLIKCHRVVAATTLIPVVQQEVVSHFLSQTQGSVRLCNRGKKWWNYLPSEMTHLTITLFSKKHRTTASLSNRTCLSWCLLLIGYCSFCVGWLFTFILWNLYVFTFTWVQRLNLLLLLFLLFSLFIAPAFVLLPPPVLTDHVRGSVWSS